MDDGGVFAEIGSLEFSEFAERQVLGISNSIERNRNRKREEKNKNKQEAEQERKREEKIVDLFK